MADQAVKLNNESKSVYFGIGVGDKRKRSTERLIATEVTAIPGVWIDIDIAGAGHKSERLPANINEAMVIVNSLPLSPSILVASGGGLHVYYLFKEPFELNTPEEKADAAWLVLGIQAMFKQKNPQYDIDATHDLSRVLRAVGTTNFKYNLPVQVIECSKYRYSFEDLEQYAAEPTITQISGTVTVFERRPTDRPAKCIIDNCKFIQHCRDNASTLSYSKWLTMLTNIGRASDGVEVAHELSEPYGKYSIAETNKKLYQALELMNPTSCQYIQKVLGFEGCPTGDCGVKNPAGWSLDASKGKVFKVQDALVVIQNIVSITPEAVFSDETMTACGILYQYEPATFQSFRNSLRGKVQLREFDKALKTYILKKDNSFYTVQGSERPTLQDSLPDCPVDLFIPSGYSFQEEGISVLVEDKPSALCPFPIVISKIFQDSSTTDQSFEISWKSGGYWHKLKEARTTIMNAAKLVNVGRGFPVSSGNARKYIQWFDALLKVNDGNFEIVTEHSVLGWHGNVYSLITQNDPVGSYSDWLRLTREVRGNPYLRFVIDSSFAAPLLKFLNCRTYTVYIWKKSGSGKTAAGYVALSIWGDPDKLKHSFNATANNIVGKLAKNNHTLFVIDDKQQSEIPQQSISKLIMDLTNGEEKGRCNIDGSLKAQRKWNTVIYSTGEEPITTMNDKAGVRNRLLEIEGAPFDNENIAKAVYAWTKEHNGHAGRNFIEGVLQVGGQYIKELHQYYVYSIKIEFPDIPLPYIDALAVQATADDLAGQFVFGNDGCTMGMIRIIAQGLATREENNDAERAKEWILSWLAQHQNKFYASSSGDTYGRFDGNTAIVLAEVLDKALLDNGFSPKKLRKELAEIGFILTKQIKKGERLVTMYVWQMNGRGAQYYFIPGGAPNPALP